MAFVRKGNVLLEVNDEGLERMLDDGFDLVDANGNVITKTIPRDPAILRRLYAESLEKIKALEAEIASLKVEPTVKATAKKSAKKAD